MSDIDVSKYVAAIAARMNDRLTAVSGDIKEDLAARIPELRGDARTIELLGASVESNVDTILHALRHDIEVERISAPAAAVEYARRLAQHGVPVNALVRAYRLGQRQMTEMLYAELRGLEMAPMTRVYAIEQMNRVLFSYIDSMSQQVVDVYEVERERWLDNQNSMRALRVRELLAGRNPVDVDAATTTIRYPLRRNHIGIVLWYPQTANGDELSALQRFTHELADAVGASAVPLFTAADGLSAWAWLPYTTPPTDIESKIRAFVGKRTDTPSLAIGGLGAGVDGFRRTHKQALGARAVALAGRRRPGAIVATADPGLAAAALLGGNLGELREWVADVLGGLARDDDNASRLRDTLRVFLRCNASYKAAAEELDMHFNSVKYRVGRAIALRGEPIEDVRLDVELALLVCHWYGSSVLTPATG